MAGQKPFPLYTDGSAVFYTTDGVNFTAVSAPTAVATPSANGLMPSLGTSGSPTLTFYSAVIDLTASAAVYTVIPPMPLRLRNASVAWEIKSVTACTVSPTFSGGTDTPASNVNASQTAAGFTTQAVETAVGVTAISPGPAADLSTNGYRISITVPATATALTARFYAFASLLPL